MESFLDGLVELEKLEDLKQKNKNFRYPTKCTNCGKIFDNPRGGTVNPRKSCSKECHLALLGKARNNPRQQRRKLLELDRRHIIDLGKTDKEKKEEIAKFERFKKESLDGFLFMDS